MDGSHPGFVHKDIDRVFLGLGLVFILDLDFGLGLFNGLDLDWFSFRIWTWTGFHFGSGLGLVFQGTLILKTGIQNLMSRFHRITIWSFDLSVTPRFSLVSDCDFVLDLVTDIGYKNGRIQR